MDKVLEWAKELQSLAQAGLFYGHDVYDKERYQRIREIAKRNDVNKNRYTSRKDSWIIL